MFGRCIIRSLKCLKCDVHPFLHHTSKQVFHRQYYCCSEFSRFVPNRKNEPKYFRNFISIDEIQTRYTSHLTTTQYTKQNVRNDSAKRCGQRFTYTTENSKKPKESKLLTIPNVLTCFRLAISPYIGYLVVTQDFTSALGLFMLAGATDSIDGWIARNVKGQSSILGSYIDPLADKVLVSILTFSLTWVNIIPVALCGLIISRDVMIMSTAAHFHYKHLEPPKTMERFLDFENSKVQMKPTMISKYNTFLQLGLVALSIMAPVFGFVDHPCLKAYWYLVASTTVLSGMSYLVKDKSNYFVK